MSQANTFCHLEGKIDLRPPCRIHMVGIGGIGMQGLALLAVHLGFRVSGSDREEREGMARLRAAGIPVFLGEDAARVEGAGAVVYSLAVSDSSAELCRARDAGIPLYSRADLLGFLGGFYPVRVGIAGTHGKSTVTAMVGQILRAAGRSPTVLCGAVMQGSSPFWAGEGDVFVYEACEYGDSFLATSPTVAAVTNMEFDHPDWFRNAEAVRSSFLRYLRKPSVTAAILPSGDGLRDAIPGDLPCVTFGEGGTVGASKTLWKGACASFLLSVRGMEPVGVHLGAAGEFQVANALCAAAVCHGIGVAVGDIVKGLESYRGIGRRMERLGSLGGATVYCDYAHHPTEIGLSLATAHRLKGGGRAVTVFQPHTYSRTQVLYREFVEALRGAEYLAILAPYAARETKDPLQSAKHLAEDLGAIYFPDRERAREWIREHAGEGDAVFLIGAGDVADLFARDELNPPRECEGQARDSCKPSPP